ncbi:hypothetical protein GCM10017044_25310 [Kordiimonas sediminis]|uniref:DUF4440 domain-containing protein n=1 Tax=Kordiimonas sediminis TaxID=1735581 RepID=A0A919E8M7_9PROT|nr:nuclear transport factor 2 family protein [Kordiimonas sediminis]GHF28998.1 hypothetical protein GCM10017044_25310 [Kordiimonas sediminis]
MKKLVFLCWCTFLAVTAVSAQGTQSDILAAVDQFQSAYKAGDVETLEALLADDYLHTNSDGGIVPVEDWLAWNRSRSRQLADGILKVLVYDITDRKIVRPLENVVIVSQVITVHTEADGEISRRRLRTTETWVRLEQTWKRSSFHDSKILYK